MNFHAVRYSTADKNMVYFVKHVLLLARWKTRGRGPGVRGPGVWRTRGLVENTGCGKHGVWWKTRGVENTGPGGKHGVSVENTGSKCKTQRNH